MVAGRDTLGSPARLECLVVVKHNTIIANHRPASILALASNEVFVIEFGLCGKWPIESDSKIDMNIADVARENVWLDCRCV